MTKISLVTRLLNFPIVENIFSFIYYELMPTSSNGHGSAISVYNRTGTYNIFIACDYG